MYLKSVLIKKASLINFIVLIFILSFIGQFIGIKIAEKTSYQYSTTCMDGINYYLPASKSFWQLGKPLQRDGSFCVHQPPFYPLVLSPFIAIGESFGISVKKIVQILNIIFSSLAVTGVFFISLKFFTSVNLALFAALSYAAYPLLIWLCRDAYSEPLFTMLLIYGIFLVLRANEIIKLKEMIAGMVLLGLATLTKGVGLLIPVMLFCGLYIGNHFNKQKFFIWGCGIGVYLLTLTPWCVIASIHTGRIVLVTTSFLPSHIHGLTSISENPISKLATSYFTSDITGFKSVFKFHQNMFSSQPIEYFLFWIQKLMNCWYVTASGVGQSVVVAINLTILVFALIGIIILIQKNQCLGNVFVLLLVLTYFWGMTTLVWSVARYMVPIMWIVILFAVVGADNILKILKKNKNEENHLTFQ